ncbi:MerR family transcriptional regulator [Pediococcus acidilactici]|uniref:MerR family transcriptional regulator n=1 Tax=Pediococcus acidilactici TaxID=1254 RepID=UPI003CF33D72
MYSIQDLAKLAGISSRTLRYYDQIGLLVPARRTESGTRWYAKAQVDDLQRILFFKTLGVSLATIREIMAQPLATQIAALEAQRVRITEKQRRLQDLDVAIASSIKMLRGVGKMSDSEKFNSLKAQRLAENESQFGQEIRQKYGEETVEVANQHYLALSEAQLQRADELEKELGTLLREALAQHSDATKAAIFTAHQEWLKIMVGKQYSPAYHQNLAQMYHADERFQKHYDELAGQNGAGQLLSEVILAKLR